MVSGLGGGSASTVVHRSCHKSFFHRKTLQWGLGILVTMAALWSGAVAGAYCFLKYKRGFAAIRFADMVLPHRWPRFEASRGDHYVALGEQKLRVGAVPESLSLLRAGLSKSPANARGRLLLTELYR